MSKIRKLIRSRGAGIALAVAAAAVAVVAGVVGLTNWHMIASVDDTIAYTFDGEHEQLSEDALKRIDDFNAQCIIVPGASVYPNGNPSPMLRNRLDAAVALYKSGGAPAIPVGALLVGLPVLFFMKGGCGCGSMCCVCSCLFVSGRCWHSAA